MDTTVHREIQFDCGHRVPDHASKCRSPHGHRYRIVATCAGEVMSEQGNPENGMVIDFGNIKKAMMDVLDAIFDHAFVLSHHDKRMMAWYFPGEDPNEVLQRYDAEIARQLSSYSTEREAIQLPRGVDGYKVIPVNYTPTAENMARHMFHLMDVALSHRTNELRLVNIRLYETPNCYVDYERAA